MHKTMWRRAVKSIIVLGTIYALMLAGGAPSENAHRPSIVIGGN